MDESRGYVPRDYELFPEGSTLSFDSSKPIPKSEWKSRIDYLNEIESMPIHWHRRLGQRAIFNQRKSNYCWMYGTVAAVRNCYAVQGVGKVKLNPYAVAYLGKKGRNQGGFGAEACRYIDQYGIPETTVLPEFSKTLRWDRLVKASARQNKICDFQEIGQNNFEGVVNCLIGDDPAPCTVAFDWWRHLVCALGVTYDRQGNFGLLIVNSWGSKWGAGGESGGYGIIWGSKAVPFEAIAVRNVKARVEVDD
jgi:hypothetical protein